MQIAFLAAFAVASAFVVYVLGIGHKPYEGAVVGLISGAMAFVIIWLWLNRRDLRGAWRREAHTKPPPDDWPETWKRIQDGRKDQ